MVFTWFIILEVNGSVLMVDDVIIGLTIGGTVKRMIIQRNWGK